MGDEAVQTEQVRPSRLANGFNRISRDFLRAIAAARFSPAEYFLLQQAMELCWFIPSSKGATEPQPFAFNLSDLSSVSGFDRAALHKARLRLVASGVLSPLGSDPTLFLINKNYLVWREGAGKLPLSKTLCEWCKSIIRKGRTVAERQHPLLPGGNAPVAERQHAGSLAATPPVAGRQQSEASPLRTPIGEAPGSARASERVLEREERVSEEGGENAPPLPVGIDRRAPNLITPDERAELDAVAALCDVYFPMREDVRRVASMREGTFPAFWYRPAVEALRLRPTSTHRATYLLGILRGYQGEGGPPTPAARADAPPPRETEAERAERAERARKNYEAFIAAKKGV